MSLERLLHSKIDPEYHICTSIYLLPTELWIIIGFLVEENLCALSSTCRFLCKILSPLLYCTVVCRNPSVLLRCGTAWLQKAEVTSCYAKTLILGDMDQNQRLPSHWELVLKWESFVPIFASFSNLTRLRFIFQQLPRSFPEMLTSLPLMTDLSLEHCIFDGEVKFDGIELKILRLRMEKMHWMEEPSEIAFLCSCPSLKVLYLDWHHRVTKTSYMNKLQALSSDLNDLTITLPQLFTWPPDRTLRIEEQTGFLNFVNAWHGLKRLILHGSWPSFEGEVFPQDRQALPNDLELYAGPIDLFRSTDPAHLGLRNITFFESHISIAELLDFLPSFPIATRVALIGVCLEEDLVADEDVLSVAFRQCRNVEEFVIDLAHSPQTATRILKVVRRNICHLRKIRYLIIPDINDHDVVVEKAFKELHCICPSLEGIRVHDEKWMYDGETWIEIET